jgi:hypothetical protein
MGGRSWHAVTERSGACEDRCVRRVLLVTLLAFASLIGLATPAQAHSVNGAGASNFRTELRSVEPPVSGLTVRIIEGGSRIELTNDTADDAIVLGYQQEPFLRVGPSGVFENERSPATYLNRTRGGDEPIPPDADPEAEPRWVKVADGRTARWHDHRAHWMLDDDPRGVQANPDERQVVIPNWKIDLDVGGRRVVLTGDLLWVPGPSAVPWYGVAGVLAALGVAAGLLRRNWAPALAAALTVLLLADVVHALGIAGAAPGGLGTKVGAVFTDNGAYTVVGWVVGVAAIVMLLRRKPDGLFLAMFAGLVVVLFAGIADSAVLRRSEVPFAWDANVARVTVSVALGLGLGVIGGSALALRRQPPIVLEASPAPSVTG